MSPLLLIRLHKLRVNDQYSKFTWYHLLWVNSGTCGCEFFPWHY